MKRKITIITAIVLAVIGVAFQQHATAENHRIVESVQRQNSEATKLLQQKNHGLEQRNTTLDSQNKKLQKKNDQLTQQLQAKADSVLKVASAASAAGSSAAPAVSSNVPSTGHPAAGTVVSGGSGSCAAEVKKYDWPVGQALQIMNQESHGFAGTLNDNPATGDYSVGCFQINLFGSNAASRPSEAWLKNAGNNVSYAYGMWKSAGRQFCNSAGWLNTCHILSLL